MTAAWLHSISDELAAVPELATDGSGRNGSRRGLATAAFGATLLVVGFRRGGILGTPMAIAGGWLLYRSLGDLGDAAGKVRESLVDGGDGAITVERSITVGKPADELYDLARDPERLAAIAGPVAEVSAVDADDSAGETDPEEADAPDRLRWTVETPIERDLSWEMDVVEDSPGERLRWESTADAPVTAETAVRFEPTPADRETTVTLEIRAVPPGGEVAAAAVRTLEVVPETVANEVLSRFKSLAETGEISTLDGTPSARGSDDPV